MEKYLNSFSKASKLSSSQQGQEKKEMKEEIGHKFPQTMGKELHQLFQAKKMENLPSMKGESLWGKVGQEFFENKFRAIYKIETAQKLTKEQEIEREKFEAFVQGVEIKEWSRFKKAELLSNNTYYQNLSQEEQITYLHEVKGIKITQEVLKDDGLRKELEKEVFDEKVFEEKFEEYKKSNEEFSDFYESYVQEETEIKNDEAEQLALFEAIESKKNPQNKEITHRLIENISKEGLSSVSVTTYNGKTAFFTKDTLPESGKASLIIYINDSGKGVIETAKGITNELFDPMKENELSSALKNTRYRLIADYAAIQINALSNFDETISSKMLKQFIEYFEKDIRGNVSYEKKFVLLCKKWGAAKEVQEMGLGKWMKYRFFNDSEILDEIAVIEAQNEIFEFLKKSENDVSSDDMKTQNDVQKNIRVERYI